MRLVDRLARNAAASSALEKRAFIGGALSALGGWALKNPLTAGLTAFGVYGGVKGAKNAYSGVVKNVIPPVPKVPPVPDM